MKDWNLQLEKITSQNLKFTNKITNLPIRPGKNSLHIRNFLYLMFVSEDKVFFHNIQMKTSYFVSFLQVPTKLF